MWVDFHSHILPGMDDGSPDAGTSLQMLRSLRDQGVGRVVLTPHYYAHRNTVSSFLEKREAAFQRLLEAIGDEPMPELLLGAEVALEYDLEKHTDLKELCIEGTSFLMIELPIRHYSPWMLDKLVSVCYANESLPMIAHLDRYIDLYSSAQIEEIARDRDLILQINLSSLLKWSQRKRVLSWMDMGRVVVLGSDAHNMGLRAPRFDKPLKTMMKKLGTERTKQIELQSQKISEGEIPPRLIRKN